MKKILISLMVMLLLLTLTLLAALLSVYLRYLNAKELVEIEVIDVEVAAKDTVGTHEDLSCLDCSQSNGQGNKSPVIE